VINFAPPFKTVGKETGCALSLRTISSDKSLLSLLLRKLLILRPVHKRESKLLLEKVETCINFK
jgi:hypothetical protein